MRLPHHLLRHRSGVFHFRLVVPPDLRSAVGLQIIKRSLHTRDPRTALAWAYALSARYHAAFKAIRAGDMTKPTLTDLLNLDTSATRPYELSTMPGGGFSVKATDAEDHARAMEAMKLMLAATPPAAPVAATPPTPTPKASGLTLQMAFGRWLKFIEPSTLRKTFGIKSTAVGAFVKHAGLTRPVDEIDRSMVADWVQALRNEGLATPTVTNKLSYLRGFFTWARGAGHYAGADNPAEGQLTYTQREKKRRRKLGFEAFTPDQVLSLYDAKALLGLSQSARWGAVIGLYTGARVAEVGQLTLVDFIDGGGLPAIRITDAGDGQSLKNDASHRTVPLHPDLIALGIMERVKALRAAGETQFFPDAKAGSVNGMGNWLSKAFSRHLETCKVSASGTGKVGFHSLRKSVVQAMQTAKVATDYRAQFVGHDLDDEHFTYTRDYTTAELLDVCCPALRWSLNLTAVREALNGPARAARRARASANGKNDGKLTNED